MKKMLKRILLALGILIVTGIVLIAGIFLKLKSEISKMTPIETGRITGDIYALHDTMVNAYLIQSGNGFIMIDAGSDLETIKNELSSQDRDSHEIVAIFLTHSDYDHVASLSLFENAEIYLSRQEEQMINGTHPRMLFQYNEIATNDYHLLDDQQQINISDVTVHCILATGHTPGAMCYLINDRYLFTGDALSIKDGRVYEFMKLATMDQETHRKSIHKLSCLENIEYIFTAHHGISDDFDFAFSKWKDEK
jgi:glyoxylase-like metal-dependent hydrolase (beta-lactamase superfamily II)